jgi:uncharacterized membrane protein YcaP (DUF421 family)
MFFDGLDDLVRVLVLGVLSYAGIVVLLRATGKRTLSKMNAFDFIVTVALGSILASLLLNEDVTLSEGLLAIAVLCVLQYAVTWLSLRSEWFQSLVKARPAVLLSRGERLPEAMRRERVTEEEILAALRAHGMAGPEEAAAVILETDGSLTALPTRKEAEYVAMRNVSGRVDR